MRPITPRIQIVDDLKECIGKIVSTNVSPTLRARLVHFNRDLSTFEVTEAEEGGFVALNPETGTTTQGESLEEAMENLKEATSLYLQEFPMKIQTPPVLTTFEVSHA